MLEDGFHDVTMYFVFFQTFLLEKFRVAQRPNGEGNFNIFYQLFAGADEHLRQDLMLYVTSEIDEPNLYFEPVEDVSDATLDIACTCTSLGGGMLFPQGKVDSAVYNYHIDTIWLYAYLG